MKLRNLLGSIAAGAMLATTGFAETATDNPLMSEAFFTDKTTVAMVEAAIASGADLMGRDEYGATPLIRAMEGHAPIDVISFLITQGVPVNQIGGKGGLPTLYAAYAGNLEVLQVLKAAGADFKAVNYMKDGPQHWLAYNEAFDPAMLAFLQAEGLDISAQNRNGETAASMVGWSESPKALEMLAAFEAAGADPTVISGEGNDIWMNAISYGVKTPEVLEYFYSLSEDPQAANNAGLSGILLASQYGINESRLSFLESKGFDLFVETPKGENALLLNAKNGDAASLKLLLDRGFDIDSTDDRGNTVLHIAADDNEPANITALIEAGADVTAANAKGETPLMLLLARKIDDPASDDGKALIALADLMITKGADLVTADASGATPLILAVKGGQPVTRLQQILAAGADVNAVDGEGMTALMVASMQAKDPAVIDLLLAAGANKTVKDVFDDTAALLAMDNPALKDSRVLSALN